MTIAQHNSPVSAMPFLAALICFAYYNDSIAQTELFLSEIVESTAEKCIEIYNPTSAAVILSGTYRIRVGSNGGALTTKSNLTGTISPNATYVICLFSSTFAFDQSMGATGPNGDDAIVLEKNSIAVDIFGNIGCQPSGGGWTQGANSTKSSTLVRTPCTTGIPTDPVSSCPFPTLASEWIQYPEGDLSHLGTHDFNVTSTPLTPLEPICNLADPIDLLTNQNGISGEWSGNGVTNNIFDPDGLFGNISLLFTPLPNQCAPNNSTIIEVINSTTPTLDPLDPICNLADPFDLLTNQNGISGEWSGIGVSNNIFDPDGLSGNISLLFTPLPDQCATNNSTNILVNNSSAPTLDPLDPICNLADPIDLPTNQTGISGAWSGNGVSNNIFDPDGLSGNINLQFNPLSNQCATNNSTTIAVINSTAPSLDPLDPICNLADPIDLPTTQDGINGAWSGDGVSNNIFDPDGLSGSINLQFTPLLNQCATNNSTTIAVINSTTPTLDPRNPICDLADPIDLPTTQDGINGAWSGDGVSNNIFDPDGLSGSINLQFTPLPDQCATNNSITIAVINSTAPSLDPLDPICNLADPISLPTNQNGISGDWSGNGVTNNIFDPDGLSGSINLLFNPLPNQCATNNAVDILVDNSSAPTLDPLDPICNLADPIDLPTTQDGINGEWSGNGVANNIFDPNGLSGSINLLFTPLPDQCATSNSITIEVINSTAPTLDPLDPICNLAEPISLPTNQNLINGAWSGNGVLNNIFDPDGLSGNISLLFTPLPNQCATNNSTTIEVINSTAPTLDPHDPICNLADPISLPTNQNGFSGTWSGNGVTNNIFDPDGLSGNISLLFTPLPDQCARNNSTNILVYNSSAPTLNPLDPICNLADPIDLPTNQNGISGAWSGNGVTNNIFDPDGLSGSINLLFTPLPDQCATSNSITIAVINSTAPTLDPPDPICDLADPINLPTNQNGIGGAWSGNGVTNNIFGPEGLSGNISLLFTPLPNQCATNNSTTIEVINSTAPSLDPLDPICNLADPIDLLSSQDGISGVWSGNGVTNNIFDPDGLSGNINLQFTPLLNQCATTNLITIAVINSTTPTLDPLDPICNLADPIDLPTNQNGIDGNWMGNGVNNNLFDPSGLFGSINLLFTTLPDQCATSNSITFAVINGTAPTLDPPDPICDLADPINLPTNQNGISGTWSGNGVSNNIFDPVGLSGNTALLFTPLPNQCATNNSTTIAVINSTAPTLDPLDPICNLDEPISLPTNQNGINGSWSGNGVSNNIFNPDGLSGNISLLFTPLPNQCATNNSITIAIINSTTPTLDPLDPICDLADPIDLPTTQDGINGAWSGNGVTNNIFDPDGLSGNINLQFNPLSNHCAVMADLLISITAPPEVSFTSLSPSCHGQGNGSIEGSASGNSGPYNYSWTLGGQSIPGNTSHLSNLGAGTYNLNVADQHSCEANYAIELISPEPITIQITSTHETESGKADGMIETTIQGGEAPFSYLWSNGMAISALSQLADGLYGLTVTDANGCAGYASTTINPGACALEMRLDISQPSCHGVGDGAANVVVNNGTDVNFNWSLDGSPSESSIQGLYSGDYGITITDNVGCAISEQFEIQEPDLLLLTVEVTEPSGPAINDASIIATTSGGTMPYSYLWSHGTTSEQAGDLAPGTYAVSVTDDNGCESISFAEVQEIQCNLQVFISGTSLTCHESNDGKISLDVTGGRGPIVFEWSHANINQEDVDQLDAGSYEVVITDSLGCTLKKTAVLLEPPLLKINATSTEYVSDSEGYIDLEITGGTEPHQIRWSTGETSLKIQDLPSGSYAVTISDRNGCQVEETFTILKTSCTLKALAEIKHVSCFGAKDGGVSFMTEGGAQPYVLSWNNKILKDAQIIDLDTGTYVVVVIDADSCVTTVEFQINQPPLLRLTLEAEKESAQGQNDAFVAGLGHGGSIPYRYEWSTGATTDSITNLTPGTYTLTISDGNGCTSTRSTIINPYQCTLVSNISVRDVQCNGDSLGYARLDVTSEAFPVVTHWSHDPELNSNYAYNLQPGDYNVTLVDIVGCKHDWPFTIAVEDSFDIQFDVQHQNLSDLDDGQITAQISGGSGQYRLKWSTGDTTNAINHLSPGNYELTISDGFCTFSEDVEILSAEYCHLKVDLILSAYDCENQNGVLEAIVDGPSKHPSYTWSDPTLGISSKAHYSADGRYWVEVTDGNCLASDTIEILGQAIQGLPYQISTSLCSKEAAILKTDTAASSPNQYFLNEIPISLNTQIDLQPGNYIIKRMDPLGCIYEETFEIAEKPELIRESLLHIKRGEEVALVASITQQSYELWYGWESPTGPLCFQCLSYNVSPSETTKYNFSVSDGKECTISETTTVYVDQRELIYLPNAISPNNDGQNDAFVVYDGLELVEEVISLQIYDKRGLRVYRGAHFQSNEEPPEFMNMAQQLIAPQVYMYLLEVQFKEGFKRHYQGSLTIVQ